MCSMDQVLLKEKRLQVVTEGGTVEIQVLHVTHTDGHRKSEVYVTDELAHTQVYTVHHW